MSINEPLTRDRCEELMDFVMQEALHWLRYVSQEDLLQDYFLSLPIDVERQKLDELAHAPAYQVVGRLEYFTVEAEKLKNDGRQEQINLPNAPVPATCDVLGGHIETRAHAEDGDVAMTRPDSSSSEDTNISPVMPTSWPHQIPPAAGPASGSDSPAGQSSSGTRFDVNGELRTQVLVLVCRLGDEFIRRFARTKAKQIEGYGHYIEQQSYNDVKRALIHCEMTPKACYDWIRNIDEDDE
ncbi:hypothetical protein MCOR34_002593 [Pyricularia oryzae]|nr:hypothetical protein MCOR34_002593 [Pyricularia oryzae]KAI6590861.1 hypothetical protein MCOR04_003718 [Pyricularia oryzae]